ncbi:MAG: cobyrinic acid a,c-diamide synthase [Cyanobacteria bacterium Co-bin13]|nr:cobyrinic acid a,c-diamide synthase [Cyanobacteria bacterium Co-bin13]
MQDSDPIYDSLPIAAKQWLESLPWEQRRYVLSLCHIMCATPPEVQAEFLDDYTADGLVSRILQDKDTQQRVNSYLKRFHIDLILTETVLRRYIRQFYIHSAQDTRQQPGLYLESALKLVASSKERNSVFNYILGFELIKLMFQMSWSQHERLYRLQVNQEDFIRAFIKPIQHAHRLNSVIVPRDEGQFFARRDYFVQKPGLQGKRLIELVIATFTTSAVTSLGLSIICHPKSFQFEYDDIFAPEPQEAIFNQVL